MADVRLVEVSKVFHDQRRGNVLAVSDASLTIMDGELLVLVGPSGCGKTTTLRMIAGLERQTSGDIYIGDRLVNKLHPKDRDIAMVFQDYALYPHMTVYENMSFGLCNLRVPKAEIDRHVGQAADMLGIGDLLQRRPRELSGGQRQRVALGRAIVRSPKVFLFDEPLSNLDAQLRVQMRVELRELHARLGATMIYVTHDQVEAMTLGDRIVVMRDGVIQQIDPPQRLYDRPQNMFVARFIGAPPMNLIPAHLADGALRLGEQRLRLPADFAARYAELSDRDVILGVRPEDLGVAPGGTGTLSVAVKAVEYLGSETLAYFEPTGQTHTARLPADTSVRGGDRVELRPNFARALLFDPASGQQLAA